VARLSRTQPSAVDGIGSGEGNVIAAFAAAVPLAGTRVLEIGGMAGPGTVAGLGVSAWVSIDPRNIPARLGVVERVAGVGERLPFADESFDHVFSCNAFEHIADVPATLAECHRVLRERGRLWSRFGPVWSGPDGHHLEGLRWGGRDWIFWRDPIVPCWSHLLHSQAELAEVLATRVHWELAELSAAAIFGPWTNKWTQARLVRAFEASPLAVESIQYARGIDYLFPRFDWDHPYLDPLAEDPVGVLSQHLADGTDIMVRDLTVRMRKR